MVVRFFLHCINENYIISHLPIKDMEKAWMQLLLQNNKFTILMPVWGLKMESFDPSGLQE